MSTLGYWRLLCWMWTVDQRGGVADEDEDERYLRLIPEHFLTSAPGITI